jgi:hypothetical protein
MFDVFLQKNFYCLININPNNYLMKKILFILACILICAVGCKQKPQPQENQPQNEVETAHTPICQSCAMPLTEEFWGTNADGTPNWEYCKYCYVDGKFTVDITMTDMIEMCVSIMVEQGMPEGNARILLQETFPKLKRWQTQE